ncbi:MAG: glycyl-radical enzyme activating protein [Clostridium sp.]
MKATIINIQKYSIHDGPGIRTTVFFKGCPLNCWWCHNPESQRLKPEVMHWEEKCTACGNCVKHCPNNALAIVNGKLEYDVSACEFCSECSKYCINEARTIKGKEISVDDLFKEVIKDEIFYGESNGGVTFSGGEPLIQADFIREVLKKCKKRDIHTTIDTCGYVSWDKFEKIVDYTDLFLYDLKHMNSDKHKLYTSVSNELILENLKKLSDLGKNIFIRMPIIPGINDDEEELKKAAELLKDLNIIQVNLLPYHKMGMDKYKRLDMEVKLKEIKEPSNERMNELSKIFKNVGLKVKIGG